MQEIYCPCLSQQISCTIKKQIIVSLNFSEGRWALWQHDDAERQQRSARYAAARESAQRRADESAQRRANASHHANAASNCA